MGLLNAWQAKQLLDGRTKFTLGPYWIIDSIGQGGMGQVFKAEHALMGRTVAVRSCPATSPRPRPSPISPAKSALAKLDHPKLVRALDAGQEGNVYYLVTEYVPGMRPAQAGPPRGAAGHGGRRQIICQVAEGLEHAHVQGIIHRDVKPGNVLVSPEGEAKLSDLGLAGPLAGETRATRATARSPGTADYLSPDHVPTREVPRRPGTSTRWAARSTTR